MNRIIKPDGIAFNGRRYNSTFLQEHLGEAGVVKQINNNLIAVNVDEITLLAEAQNAVSLNDVQPALNNRVMIIDGIAVGKQGFIWGIGIDECEYLIVADDDDDYPHGYQRNQFIVLNAESNHAN